MALNDGDRILFWLDRVTGHAMRRGGSGSTGHPEFKTNIINSLPVARFNNSEFLVGSGSMMSDLVGKTGYTFFIVMSNISDSSFGAFLARDASGSRGFNTFVNNDNTMRYYVPTGGSISSQRSTQSIETGGPLIISGVYDGGTSRQDVYINGVLDNLDSPTPPATFASLGATEWRVGNDGFSDLLDGDMAEFLFWDRALTDNEFNKVYAALSTKYLIPPGNITSGLIGWFEAEDGTS